MTALTTILALITMAIGVGNGAEMMQPMAVATIGGLLYATILTLILMQFM
ncbi:MAG: efflux RND transporter permease subunit [Tenericutes bacterium]|nr:efflux RND transporter permease subunit [Mycoplasmatota bacterium]